MNKSHDAHRRLNRIRGYFYRKGKTENRENTLFKIFINNSKAKIPFKWIPGFLSFSKLTVYINLKKIIKGYSTKKKIIYKSIYYRKDIYDYKKYMMIKKNK